MFNFIKCMKRTAFTLTELLIALGVIGVLTAIVMPIVFSLAPDQNALMAKRAFYTTETVISDLLNDSYCYPKILSRAGLDDGLGYAKCKKWGGEENTGALSNEDAATKLVTLFADRLDIRGSIKNENGKKTFQTKDGMIWTFSHFNFVNNKPDSYVLLTVDVNGDKDPNCGQSAQSGQCEDKNRKQGFDRLTMRIFARGRIQLIDCWGILAAKVDKKLVGKEDAICNGQDSGTIEEECADAPTSPDDFCCNDDKWKSADVCNPCTATPTSADDYCCQEASGSSWVGTQACDPCTYTTPSSPDDECCQSGHKWNGTPVCDVCSSPYSIACCLTKKSSIEYGDKCCDHNEVKDQVPACRNENIAITSKFYVSAQKPKDSDTWGATKITSVSTINQTLPFNLEIKYIRGCPGSVGCGSYGAGMSCIINIGQTSCTASENISGSFPYKFELTKADKDKGGLTGFKPTYNMPNSYKNNYSVKFKFSGNLDMY